MALFFWLFGPLRETAILFTWPSELACGADLLPSAVRTDVPVPEPSQEPTNAAPTGLPTTAPLPPVFVGNFTSTAGGMGVARYMHTATALWNGQVLVAGGTNAGVPLVQCDLYDPLLGVFSVAPNLEAARAEHTATLLQDGTVLVIGGSGASGILATAAVFNVNGTAPTWTDVAGQMSDPRALHTATLLGNGNVLVAGGLTDSDNTTTSSTNIYSVATQAWTASANMTSDRAGHQAALLPDGTVLVVGGYSSVQGAVLASAEIFLPSLGTWIKPGPLTYARFLFGLAVLADGRVIVAGGYDANHLAQPTSEIYDPDTMTFSLVATTLSSPVVGPDMVALAGGNFVLVFGGSDQTADSRTSVDVFVLANNSWAPSVNGLVQARSGPVAVRLNGDGDVLITGGVFVSDNGDDAVVLASAEVFSATQPPPTEPPSVPPTVPPPLDPVHAGTFALTDSMADDRWQHTATVLQDGTVLIAGGNIGSITPVTVCEVYLTETGQFIETVSMRLPRMLHTATLLGNGNVLVAGGVTSNFNGFTATSTVYDPVQHTWTDSANQMSVPRATHTAILLFDGNIMVAGGLSSYSETTSSTDIYNATSGLWQPTGAMTTDRGNHQVILMDNGRIIAVGGVTYVQYYVFETLSSAESFDAARETWHPIASMNSARSLFGIAKLADGSVIVAGGRGADNVALATAEIYYPYLDEWHIVASALSSGVIAPDMLALNGGNFVILFGGSDESVDSVGVVDVFYLYNQTWTPNDFGLIQPRTGPVAVALPTDKVLITGGMQVSNGGDSRRILDSAELFYPIQAIIDPIPTPSNAPTQPGDGDADDSSGGPSVTKIIILVAIIVGGVLLIGGLGYFLYVRKSKNSRIYGDLTEPLIADV